MYSISVETTSNATAGAGASNTALQILAPSGSNFQLMAVGIFQAWTAAGENIGRWVIDRISAVATGSALTPLKLRRLQGASQITDTTKTMSTTLVATNTVSDTAILSLDSGWNDFEKYGVFSGDNLGFALRRATAPTGARVVTAVMIWKE